MNSIQDVINAYDDSRVISTQRTAILDPVSFTLAVGTMGLLATGLCSTVVNLGSYVNEMGGRRASAAFRQLDEKAKSKTA